MGIRKGTKVRRKSGLTLQERIEHYSIPEPNTGCLLWRGAVDGKGYGQLRWTGKNRAAHRLSWEAYHGQSFPIGKVACHKCDVPACVNPEHLFIGTLADNTRDMMRKGRANQTGLALGRGKVPPERQVRGERAAHAKLTASAVQSIRQDPRGSKKLAQEYGVAASTIKSIRNRKTWAHV